MATAQNRNWKYHVGQSGIVSEIHLCAGQHVQVTDLLPGVEEPGYIVSPVDRLGRSYFWLRESELLAERAVNDDTHRN